MPATCQRNKCFPCSSTLPSTKTSGNSKCWTRSCTYSITCLPCQAKGQVTQYIGESGHSGYSRGKSHWEGLSQRSKSNILHQHAVKDHGGAQHILTHKDFLMKVREGHKSNLNRQIHEGLLISSKLEMRDKERK